MRTPTLLLALLPLLLPATALGWVQSTSSKGAPIHWEEPCVGVYWNEDGSDNVEGDADLKAFQLSMDAWNKVQCSTAELQYAGLTNSTVTDYEHEDPPYSLVVFREKNWPYAQRPVAFTSVTYNPNTGVVVDADIEVNGEDFHFTTNPQLNGNAIDIQNTLTHELGHVLGFDHSADSDSTMFFQTVAGETGMRTLSQDDEEGLCTLYPAEEFATCTPLEEAYFDVTVTPQDQTSDGGCSASSSSSGLGTILALGLLAALGGGLLWLRGRGRGRAAVRLLSVMGLLFASVAPLLSPASASAWVQYLSKKGYPVHWPVGTCDVYFSVQNGTLPGVPEGMEFSAIQDAFNAWNASSCGPVKFRLRDTLLLDAVIDAEDGINVIAFLSKKWTDPREYVALTTLTYYSDNGEMYDADIAFNDYFFDFSDCENISTVEAINKVDYRFTVLHEVGHLYGLDHSADPTALLYSSGSPYCDQTLPTALSQDDIDGTCAIYGGEEYTNAACKLPEEPSPEVMSDFVEQPDGQASDLDASEVVNPDADEKKPDSPCCHSGLGIPSSPWPLLGALFLLISLAVRARFRTVRRQRLRSGVCG